MTTLVIGRSVTGSECAWCVRDAGAEPTPGASHGICPPHLDTLKREITARRVTRYQDLLADVAAGEQR